MVCLDLQCPADLLQMQMSFSVHYAPCSHDIQTITSYIILGGFLTLKLDYATFNRFINKQSDRAQSCIFVNITMFELLWGENKNSKLSI